MTTASVTAQSIFRVGVLVLLMMILVPAPRGRAAESRAPTLVEVAGHSTVEGDRIALGQIARIEGSDRDLAARLETVPLGQSPLPGDSRNLTETDLLLRLRQSGIEATSIRLLFPEKATVVRRAVTIEAGQIREMVANFLQQHLPRSDAACTVKDIRVPDRIVLPSGKVKYEIYSAHQGALIGTFPVAIDFKVNEKHEKKVWATVTVEALTDVVVTVRPLGRFRPITEADIEVRRVDMADLPADAIGNPEDVIGKRTRVAVQSNMVLRTDLVELPPLVKRGDMVTILVQSEGLMITALGQVNKTGRQGERIPVVNFDSKKVIFARVLDANTVEVEY